MLLKDILPENPHRSSIVTDVVEFNSLLYFGATDGSGPQLWKSDGTTDGTVMVSQVNGLGNRYCEFYGFLATEDKIIFSASDGTNGMELWISDGTASGTGQVADINPGIYSSDPSLFNSFNNAVYFSANDGIHCYEMWEFDCSSEEVSFVRDINTSPVGSIGSLLCAGDELFYDDYEILRNLEDVALGLEQDIWLNPHNVFEKIGDDYIIAAFTNEYGNELFISCLLYTSPSPRDATLSRMPSSA